ncbi:hypothetical protein NEDG_01151 [Nematocida displodere]|uniref:Uncharacterized protein n=1 Tax=Nematocida displodere TaxID=1805483 RepID=A0A177ECX1_9MICR|nr:hypothetical protein NEDG_01151 [Nematocida displodere]
MKEFNNLFELQSAMVDVNTPNHGEERNQKRNKLSIYLFEIKKVALNMFYRFRAQNRFLHCLCSLPIEQIQRAKGIEYFYIVDSTTQHIVFFVSDKGHIKKEHVTLRCDCNQTHEIDWTGPMIKKYLFLLADFEHKFTKTAGFLSRLRAHPSTQTELEMSEPAQAEGGEARVFSGHPEDHPESPSPSPSHSPKDPKDPKDPRQSGWWVCEEQAKDMVAKHVREYLKSNSISHDLGGVFNNLTSTEHPLTAKDNALYNEILKVSRIPKAPNKSF